MHAELQLLSSLVPVRQVSFLRFCKQHAEGVWAVVDVSIDSIREGSSSSCRRLPSGCLVQDMANGYSKVTQLIITILHVLIYPNLVIVSDFSMYHMQGFLACSRNRRIIVM